MGNDFRVFISRDPSTWFGWIVCDHNGMCLGYTFTKWGALRTAYRALQSYKLEEITLKGNIFDG